MTVDELSRVDTDEVVPPDAAGATAATASTAGASGSTKKRGGGRRPDPAVQKRNKKMIAAHKQGASINDLCSRFGTSADVVRKVLSEARKRRELPPVEGREM
jgi:DNA invertase Pin-like site-specific DNA recombinase